MTCEGFCQNQSFGHFEDFQPGCEPNLLASVLKNNFATW